MSIFGSIASAIFGGHATAASVMPLAGATVAAPSGAAPTTSAAPPQATVAPPPTGQTGAVIAPTPAGAAASSTPASTPAPTPAAGVDVIGILEGLQAKQHEPLAWRTSIVDLMKLLHIDSGLAARKELATELHYPGDMSDSAAMNVWLHKQVMTKLAENGGVVPADLKH